MTVRIPKAGLVQQALCAGGIVIEAEDVRLEGPSQIGNEANCRPAQTTPEISDDGVAIGGIANSVPHTDVSQYGISKVEAQVEEVESRRALDREPAALLELVDDVGRQIVDDEIGRTLAQLETAHRVVGNDLHHDAGVVGQAVPIPFERGEHESVVRFVADEPVRPGADRKRSQRSRRHRLARRAGLR